MGTACGLRPAPPLPSSYQAVWLGLLGGAVVLPVLPLLHGLEQLRGAAVGLPAGGALHRGRPAGGEGRPERGTAARPARPLRGRTQQRAPATEPGEGEPALPLLEPRRAGAAIPGGAGIRAGARRGLARLALAGGTVLRAVSRGISGRVLGEVRCGVPKGPQASTLHPPSHTQAPPTSEPTSPRPWPSLWSYLPGLLSRPPPRAPSSLPACDPPRGPLQEPGPAPQGPRSGLGSYPAAGRPHRRLPRAPGRLRTRPRLPGAARGSGAARLPPWSAARAPFAGSAAREGLRAATSGSVPALDPPPASRSLSHPAPPPASHRAPPPASRPAPPPASHPAPPPASRPAPPPASHRTPPPASHRAPPPVSHQPRPQHPAGLRPPSHAPRAHSPRITSLEPPSPSLKAPPPPPAPPSSHLWSPQAPSAAEAGPAHPRRH